MKTSTTTKRRHAVQAKAAPVHKLEPISLKNRRLLFFLNWLRPGAGMINRELAFAEQLAERGAEVTLLSHFKPQIRPTNPAIRVRTLIPTGFRHRWYNHALTRRLVDFRTRQVFKTSRPEIVFTDLPVEAERALRIRDRMRLGAKDARSFRVAYTYHGTADGSAYDADTATELARQRAFSHRMLRSVDLPIVVSDHLVREARAEGSAPVRIYNGVDLDHWRPAHPTTTEASRYEPLRVLYVGRYTECKGVLSLVRAFGQAAAQAPNAILEMHGFFESPAYEAKIRDAIAATGVSTQIEMHGPIDFADIPKRVRTCTVFANGSVDESFCMPFLEAQACGRTCVGFHARGIPEVVLHERTGLLAPPGDEHTFGDYMTRLLLDTELRQRFERAALRHARTFDYKHLTAELVDQLTAHLPSPYARPPFEI